jgi:menaquinone-specific isochorismate synthase
VISDIASTQEFSLPLARLLGLRGERPLLVSYSMPWSGPSITSLLKHATEYPRLYWQNGDHALVGWGAAVRLMASGETRFGAIQNQAEQLFARSISLNPDSPASSAARLVGGFSFQTGVQESQWSGFPEACFVLPKFQFTSQAGQAWVTINCEVKMGESAGEVSAKLCRQLETIESIRKLAEWSDLGLMAGQAVEIDVPVSLETWRNMVSGAVSQIRKGVFEKVVLARTLQVHLPRPPALEDLLASLGKRYPDCYRFLIELEQGRAFLGATPELLVKVNSRIFRTSALAGTIARGDTPEKDHALGQELLSSTKDREEHAIVVRALEEKLRPLVTVLNVAPQPELRRLRNVQHLETAVHGHLADCCSLLDVAAALHPTPALGGWPAENAITYLRQAEPFNRGWYAAPVGWFDALGNGLFAVAIRSGLFDGRSATLFAGAGIVADSDPDKEWQETHLKFRPLLEALQGAW